MIYQGVFIKTSEGGWQLVFFSRISAHQKGNLPTKIGRHNFEGEFSIAVGCPQKMGDS